jgi:hypothetical protein
MNTACVLLVFYVVVAIGQREPGQKAPDSLAFHARPYRVLVVVERWSDPHGLVITTKTDKFQPVAALLQAWSVPFDIVRLDQQHLDASFLFDRDGNVRYGTIVWLADPSSYADQDLASIEAATRGGTGLIAIDSRVLDPTLDRLMGLSFTGFYSSTDPIQVAQEHYITRGFAARDGTSSEQRHDYSDRLWIRPTTAAVLMAQGPHPILTENQLGQETYAIWLGSPNLSTLSHSAFWRDLFFRSLVWSLGYVVVPNVDYANRIILELDDWGTADKGFLSYWRYLEPQAGTIYGSLVIPLKRHHGVATAEVDTGYVDRKSQRVLSPWVQNFTDLYGLHQDYASTYQGLKDAADAGVLDIESHGWTHMNPNLQSAPGPWWTADLAGEGSMVGWYAEFQDQRRGEDVPALTQIYHMQRSRAELQQDFGKQALELKPGNNSWSKSQFDNTAGLAARIGFGLFHGDTATFYLDRDRVLEMADLIPDFNTAFDLLSDLHPERWPNHPDGPLILGFHDRDIALDPDFMEQLFTALPGGYKTLGMNQYIGILHTQISSTADRSGLRLAFTQGADYGSYFATHPSSWRLWLSDPVRKQLAALYGKISIDDRVAPTHAADFRDDTVVIDLPPGLGEHVWAVGTKENSKEP